MCRSVLRRSRFAKAARPKTSRILNMALSRQLDCHLPWRRRLLRFSAEISENEGKLIDSKAQAGRAALGIVENGWKSYPFGKNNQAGRNEPDRRAAPDHHSESNFRSNAIESRRFHGSHGRARPLFFMKPRKLIDADDVLKSKETKELCHGLKQAREGKTRP